VAVIRVADVRYPVTALGPGTRLAIWTQGCSIGCAGCMSRNTWDPAAVDGEPVDALVARALDLVDGPLDGVTISGGEPFEQPEALAELIDRLRDRLGPIAETVDVLCYSGRPWDELATHHSRILERLDALIPEPYQAASPTESPWRGSANQPLILLSRLAVERYSDTGALADPLSTEGASQRDRGRPAVQVDVTNDRVTIIGVPRRGDLARVERHLADAGISLRQVSWRP
jgi:anaerobic ribonucleoside-triphosphate reductase activating protein